MTGRSNPRAYSIARRIMPAFGTGRPSSETAMMPASFISPISARSVPSEFFVIAPMGSKLASQARSACSITNRANRVEASGDSGGGAARDRLFVLVTRFAQVHVHIDEARRNDQSGRVEDF